MTRLLLDTHALLWYLDHSLRLPPRVRELVRRDDVQPMASYASVWEIAIKSGLGNLQLDSGVAGLVAKIDTTLIQWLPIELPHLLRVADLALHHRDPFDRLIAAQCLAEGLPLLSADPAFDNYGVDRRW